MFCPPGLHRLREVNPDYGGFHVFDPGRRGFAPSYRRFFRLNPRNGLGKPHRCAPPPFHPFTHDATFHVARSL